MERTSFDSLAYMQELRDSGISIEQASAMASATRRAFENMQLSMSTYEFDRANHLALTLSEIEVFFIKWLTLSLTSFTALILFVHYFLPIRGGG